MITLARCSRSASISPASRSSRIRCSAGAITSPCSVVAGMPSSIAVAIAPSAVSASPRSSAVAYTSSVLSTRSRGSTRSALARVRAGALEHFHERVEQHRVEVPAALFAHHLHGLLDREGLAIDAIAGERVEHVGDRDDPPLDRDRLAAQPARVAGSVPLLLVAERDRRSQVEDRGGGASHAACGPPRRASR